MAEASGAFDARTTYPAGQGSAPRSWLPSPRAWHTQVPRKRPPGGIGRRSPVGRALGGPMRRGRTRSLCSRGAKPQRRGLTVATLRVATG